MADLHLTVILRSVAEALTEDALVLLDQVESYCYDDSDVAGSEASTKSDMMGASASDVLSPWLSRMIDELMRCMAQAKVDPERSGLATDFAADWGNAEKPPSARALGEAAIVLFSRWDRIYADWTLETRISSPARDLQHELTERLASAEARWAA